MACEEIVWWRVWSGGGGGCGVEGVRNGEEILWWRVWSGGGGGWGVV